MTEWTADDARAELRRRQAIVDAGYCPDSGERLTPIEHSTGLRWVCFACAGFGYPSTPSGDPRYAEGVR